MFFRICQQPLQLWEGPASSLASAAVGASLYVQQDMIRACCCSVTFLNFGDSFHEAYNVKKFAALSCIQCLNTISGCTLGFNICSSIIWLAQRAHAVFVLVISFFLVQLVQWQQVMHRFACHRQHNDARLLLQCGGCGHARKQCHAAPQALCPLATFSSSWA